jgi:hypothetical protein
MEEIMQYFLDLLQVTGGDLAPEKCACCKSKNGTDKAKSQRHKPDIEKRRYSIGYKAESTKL